MALQDLECMKIVFLFLSQWKLNLHGSIPAWDRRHCLGKLWWSMDKEHVKPSMIHFSHCRSHFHLRTGGGRKVPYESYFVRPRCANFWYAWPKRLNCWPWCVLLIFSACGSAGRFLWKIPTCLAARRCALGCPMWAQSLLKIPPASFTRAEGRRISTSMAEIFVVS